MKNILFTINEQILKSPSKCTKYLPNNGDYRKIAVIDGKVAFTGGINLADEYINVHEKHGR